MIDSNELKAAIQQILQEEISVGCRSEIGTGDAADRLTKLVIKLIEIDRLETLYSKK